MHCTLRRSAILLIVVTLLLSGIAPISTAEPADNQFRPIADSETVTIWDRALLPFRADTTDAATIVPNLNLFVNVPAASTGDVPANKDSLAVYNDDAAITLRFQSRIGADTSRFADDNVQLLVAKVKTSSTITTEEDSDDTPFEHGLRLLSPQNDIATYELLNGTEIDTDSNGRLDSNGEATFTYDLSQQMKHDGDRGAGKYVFFVVQNSQNGGFTVDDNGNLSVTDEAKVLGVDDALVHQAPATVSTSNIEYNAGDSVQFSVDANLPVEGSTNHAIILYKQEGETGDGFINQKAVLVANETTSSSLSTENISLQHSINRLNGVAKTEGNVSIVGQNLSDGHANNGVGMPGLVEWVSEKSGTTLPSSELIEPNDSLHASATAVRTQTTTTLTVETLANWSAGTYRYIYVASSDNGSVISTQTDLLTVRSADYAPGGSGDGDAPSGTPPNTTNPPTDVDHPRIIDEAEAQIDATTRQVAIRFNRSQVLSQSAIQFSGETTGVVRFQELSGLPSNVSSGVQEGQSLVSQFHIYVPAELRAQSASMQFMLAESAVTSDPSTLTVLHYNETAAEWDQLETTVISQENGMITIEATTPGFSLFALRQGPAQQQTPAEPRVTPDEPPSTPQNDAQQDDVQNIPDEEDGDSNEGVIPGFMSTLAYLVVIVLVLPIIFMFYKKQ